jgi:hypothetical protein
VHHSTKRAVQSLLRNRLYPSEKRIRRPQQPSSQAFCKIFCDMCTPDDLQLSQSESESHVTAPWSCHVSLHTRQPQKSVLKIPVFFWNLQTPRACAAFCSVSRGSPPPPPDCLMIQTRPCSNRVVASESSRFGACMRLSRSCQDSHRRRHASLASNVWIGCTDIQEIRDASLGLQSSGSFCSFHQSSTLSSRTRGCS